ncbi:MAG: hypothetical protein J0L64_20905 [Acidobacteria bacterium]|nr:hypothetical protein [Acidobacteriota bacterium]
MKRRRVFIPFLAATAFAAILRPPFASFGAQSSRELLSESGIVVAKNQETIHLKGSSGPVTVKIKPTTRIWKGEDGADSSVIHPGDELAMRGTREADGTFSPTQVWVNIVSFHGVIAAVSGNTVSIEVLRNDSLSQTRQVRLTSKTLSSGSSVLKRENVKVGRPVQVVGVALEDGTVQATRLMIYVNGREVDSRATKYVDPLTGKIIDKP